MRAEGADIALTPTRSGRHSRQGRRPFSGLATLRPPGCARALEQRHRQEILAQPRPRALCRLVKLASRSMRVNSRLIVRPFSSAACPLSGHRRLQRGDARFDILDLNGLGRVIEDCFCHPYRPNGAVVAGRFAHSAARFSAAGSAEPKPANTEGAYNADKHCCSANVSSELQQALLRHAAQRPILSQRGEVPHSLRTVRNGASHPARLVCVCMFR